METREAAGGGTDLVRVALGELHLLDGTADEDGGLRVQPQRLRNDCAHLRHLLRADPAVRPTTGGSEALHVDI